VNNEMVEECEMKKIGIIGKEGNENIEMIGRKVNEVLD
jgi:hypothetical protein